MQQLDGCLHCLSCSVQSWIAVPLAAGDCDCSAGELQAGVLERRPGVAAAAALLQLTASPGHHAAVQHHSASNHLAATKQHLLSASICCPESHETAVNALTAAQGMSALSAAAELRMKHAILAVQMLDCQGGETAPAARHHPQLGLHSGLAAE